MKTKNLLWLILFSVAMGFMESAVVIYLRMIYYPNGFQFPLVPLDTGIGQVEIFREAATIVMLLAIGILSGKTSSTRFAGFIFSFAVWDLSYYFFLWVVLGWPQSIFTWDILFLIPVPWVGPVLAPCIIAISMIMLALSIIKAERKGSNSMLSANEWAIFILGSAIVICSFIWDYVKYAQRAPQNADHMLASMKAYVPSSFNWPLFIAGEACILFGIMHFNSNIKKTDVVH